MITNLKDYIELEEYKGIKIYFNKNNSKLEFEFEKRDRAVNYLFEAKGIIDSPVWIDCDLTGFFVDGYFDKFVGRALAQRKNIKSGEPDWLYKGQYDMDFKRSNSEFTVYPDNEHNRSIYFKWGKQREVYHKELQKLNDITKELSK